MNYNDIYPIVRRHIDKMDFYGLLADGAPSDEFEIEAEMVARAIRPDMSADEITLIIANIFNEQFSTSHPLSEFAPTAEGIKSELVP